MGVTVSVDGPDLVDGHRLLPARAHPHRQAAFFVIGEVGLAAGGSRRRLHAIGLYEQGADTWVCGMDRGLSWDKIATATLNIAPSRLVGTNPDLTLPTERGVTHGNGAILARCRAATAWLPIVIGKPEPTNVPAGLRLLALRRTRHWPSRPAGHRYPRRCARRPAKCVVLSGISQRADLGHGPRPADLGHGRYRELTAEILAGQPAL